MPSEVVLPQDVLTPVYHYEGKANTWSDWRKTATLIKHLTRRHLAARYRSSTLGFLWSLLNPMFMMAVYTFVFRIIFRTTVPGVPYPVFFLTGILAWNFFSTAVINAAVSTVDGASLMNKVAFPRFALPVSAVLSNAINYLMTLPLLLIFNLLFGITPTASFLLFPVALLLLLLGALGVGLLLAAVLPFFRDLQHLIEVLFTMWLFLTPVFYGMNLVAENLPESLLPVYNLNPMVGIICLVHTVFLGQPLPGNSLAVAVVGVIGLFSMGLWVFQRRARHFSEL